MNKTKLTGWRLLKDGIRDPFRHFAVEEALSRGIDEGFTPPTLRLRQTEPSVWIGVYQYPEEDVDIVYCAGRNIKIVRRPNPGGAVYQDQGSFCYSLFFPKAELFRRLAVSEPAQLYSLIGKAVIETCGDFGAKAELSPVNDITIGGRKVYGSAQVEFYSAFVHSGTFLVKTDLEEMERCLKPSRLKFSDKGFTNVKDRVINLSTAVGKDLEIEVVMETLTRRLVEVLNIEPRPGILTPPELELIDTLHREKYSDPAWTFRKKDSYDTVVAMKAKSGVITVGVSWEGDIISALHVEGDFLNPDQGELARIVEALKGKSLDRAAAIIDSGGLPGDIKEALTELLVKSGRIRE